MLIRWSFFQQAGPGLGSALAEAFALAGHPVAIGARTQSKVDKIANEINEKIDNGYQNVKAFSVDATDTNSVRQFVKQASKAWSPDTFLHVGIWNPNAGFGARPFNQWTETQMQEAFKVQV